jgi:HPt (histidine-containing phosphotransfer) domain-containing protein
MRTDVDVENKLAPLLDRAHLDAQTFGDADLAREVLTLFEEQCRRLLPALAEEGRPAGERADLAHTLKGAALGVGAMRVAEASAAVETGLRGDGTADLDALRSAAARTVETLGAFGLEA